MLPWLLSILAGTAVAALQYGRTFTLPRALLPSLLRAVAVALVLALLLDAPVGRATVHQEVALDASESFTRGTRGADVCWPHAVDSAVHTPGMQLRFGEFVREGIRGEAPRDHSSSLRPVADRAAGSGTPVVVVTDGELDDNDQLAMLPRGSRIIVVPCSRGPDVALAGLDVPRSLLSGDSVSVRVALVAGESGGPAGHVELRLDDLLLASSHLGELGAYGERSVELRGMVSGRERNAILRAIYVGAGDVEPRNDTLSVGVDVTRAPAGVFVSTAPDYDAREAIAVLRGVTSLPTRGYYRVTPGEWRSDGTLARVSETEVRSAMRNAPLVVLHGDTALFGDPRATTRGSLLLFVPPRADEGEWFASAIPPSPLSGMAGSLPVDSLPPLNVAPPGATPQGQWQGLVTHRGGAPDERRIALTGWDEPRRIAVLAASGFWRWRFRGGVRADAYTSFFGALYDWLAAGRHTHLAVVLESAPVRTGMPVRWRRASPADSVVQLTLRRRDATARVQSVTLHFGDGVVVAESPSLPPGIYDALLAGGSLLLAVNPSREFVPRRPSVRSGAVGGAPAVRGDASLRDVGWIYALVILALCTEWVLRRSAGLT